MNIFMCKIETFKYILKPVSTKKKLFYYMVITSLYIYAVATLSWNEKLHL